MGELVKTVKAHNLGMEGWRHHGEPNLIGDVKIEFVWLSARLACLLLGVSSPGGKANELRSLLLNAHFRHYQARSPDRPFSDRAHLLGKPALVFRGELPVGRAEQLDLAQPGIGASFRRSPEQVLHPAREPADLLVLFFQLDELLGERRLKPRSTRRCSARRQSQLAAGSSGSGSDWLVLGSFTLAMTEARIFRRLSMAFSLSSLLAGGEVIPRKQVARVSVA